MKRTEFMNLYEELDSLNEAIDEIDFKALEEAEKEAERLWTEIRELDNDYRAKLSSAKNANAVYAQLSKEIRELESQIRDLRHTYERRVWYRVGYDDYEDDIEIDEVQYEKVKDREKELYDKVSKLTTELRQIEREIEAQFEEESNNLRSKRTERDTHVTTSKNIKDQVKQSFAEVEAEVNAVASFLTTNLELEWKVDPKSIFYKDGKIQVRLFAQHNAGSDFDLDDFGDGDDLGELTDRKVEWEAESFAEDYYVTPDVISEELELQLVEDGAEKWYAIPDSAWMLSSVTDDIYDVQRPEVSNYSYTPATYWEPAECDYDIDGDLILEASLYIGKKVRMAEDIQEDVQEEPKEVIAFIDCSGSNYPYTIDIQKEIALDHGAVAIKYFSGIISDNAEEAGMDGRTIYNGICEFAKANEDKSILVITDSDVDHNGRFGGDELKTLPNVTIERLENYL